MFAVHMHPFHLPLLFGGSPESIPAPSYTECHRCRYPTIGGHLLFFPTPSARAMPCLHSGTRAVHEKSAQIRAPLQPPER